MISELEILELDRLLKLKKGIKKIRINNVIIKIDKMKLLKYLEIKINSYNKK